MYKDNTIEYKDMGEQSPFAVQIGNIHRIDDEDKDSKQFSWTGKLKAIVGKNLLFEKVNGCRILVDPTAVKRIIELPPRSDRSR